MARSKSLKQLAKEQDVIVAKQMSIIKRARVRQDAGDDVGFMQAMAELMPLLQAYHDNTMEAVTTNQPKKGTK